MSGYKIRKSGSFSSGGDKIPLKRCLSVIGNADTIEALKPRKKTPIGHQ